MAMKDATVEEEMPFMKGWSKPRRDVFLAAKELCLAKGISGRMEIADLAGMDQQRADDHIRCLKDDGFLRRLAHGVFVIVPQEEDRPVWATITPAGFYKAEIGEQVVNMTLGEARRLAQLMGGLLMFGQGGQ